MPRSIGSALLAGALLVLPIVLVSSSRADDFGRFLERAAGNTLRQALEPQEPNRAATTAPGTVPAGGDAEHGEPVAVRTADGWTLVAHHYKPTPAPRVGAMPVILCHGLTYNALFWDLVPEYSFAEYLAAQGFDVWAVSLRGGGLSQKWV